MTENPDPPKSAPSSGHSASAAAQPLACAPDTGTIDAFLEDRHRELAGRLGEFAASRIAPLPEPADDAAAREQARDILGMLGEAGWLAPIGDQDFRACCLVREALAAASPLADAVFAIQALGCTALIVGAGDSDLAGAGDSGPASAGDSDLAGAGDSGPASAGDTGRTAGRAAAGDHTRWLRAAVSGEAMAAFAMTEPEAGSDVASLTTLARREGDSYVLEGKKTLISNAGIADFYVVFATVDPGVGRDGITCFLVPVDTGGLRFGTPQVLSAPHPLGEIELADCRVPESTRVGPEGGGYRIGMGTLDRVRPTVGAAACGMAARALREALEHAVRREQFGRPLAAFELIQSKLGRMATELAASRLLVYRAAWERDRGAERTTVESAMAKAAATEAAQRIVDEAVQILGGIGVLASHPVDRLYRSVRAPRIYEGTTEIQRLVIGGHLVRAAQAR